MQSFPHHYRVRAGADAEGDVTLTSGSLPALQSAAPTEFGGPGDRWSPEVLLVAAVADCFVLTFRALARASKLDWQSIECSAEGVLERVERVTQFTAFRVKATLRVPTGTDPDRARRVLERAEQSCFITCSLKGRCDLDAEVEVASA